MTGKYRVWIHARTHPGETPSSWHFDGIVQKLLSDDEVISYYRQKVIFYLIPFTNPDGVYYGRSRTNYSGIDVESNWNKTEAQTSKEVKILKQRMTQINSEKVLSVFNNLHSQAAPYCTFWIHTPGSTSPRFYRREYQFSNLNTSDNPYFVPGDYSESDLQAYFPEGWLWSNHGEQVMALTYETPYDQYSSDVWVTNSNLFEIGSSQCLRNCGIFGAIASQMAIFWIIRMPWQPEAGIPIQPAWNFIAIISSQHQSAMEVQR